MEYKKKTPYFGIPIPCKGDRIDESEETIARNIIENQLLGNLKGVKCAVFEEGCYKLNNNNDGSFSVSLSKSNANYAFCGIVGGAYSESLDPVLWDGLEDLKKYYLYIQFSGSLFINPNSFRICFSTSEKKDVNGFFLLMAIVDLTNDNKITDSNPPNKIYGSDIATHSLDNTNPHGEILNQDIINSKEINLDNLKLKDKIESTEDLILKDKRNEFALTDDNNNELKTNNKTIIGSINEINTLKTKILEVETVGKDGLNISINDAKKIEFVSYNIIKIGSISIFKNIGNVMIGYFQQDETVKDEKSFKFYNDGENGIKIKLLINYKN